MTSTASVNEAFYFITAVSALLFFGIVFLMILFLVRYRRSRNPEATEIPGNLWLEVTWIVVPTVIVLVMFVYGLTGFTLQRTKVAGSLEVEVHTRQWSFLFEYPSGIKSPDLVAPSGRDVRITLESDDVIHAFYLPAYRVQIDAVPGMKTYANFRTGAVGSFDILCAQYCGTLHSSMLAKLYVLPPADYDRWTRGEKVQLAGKNLPPTAATGLELLRQRSCLACHSTDGSPLAGPTFKGLFGSTVEVMTAGSKRSVVADEAFIRKSIVDPAADIAVGFQNIMPSGKDSFGKDDLDEAVEAIKALK
ncbi:MAG TPA: cytochrome c oxidase subunit II [Rectinemataceae bacterium]|nr:cytochrome c oxidase subunit II [Rectinemataceae bacterium]